MRNAIISGIRRDLDKSLHAGALLTESLRSHKARLFAEVKLPHKASQCSKALHQVEAALELMTAARAAIGAATNALVIAEE